MSRRVNQKTYKKNNGGSHLTKQQKNEVKRIANQSIKKSYPIQQDMSSYDKVVTSTVQSESMLNSLLGVTLPKMNTDDNLPLYNIPGEDYRRLKVMITGVYLTILVRGSTGTALASSDLYNNIRIRCSWSNATFSESPVFLAPTSIPAPVDTRDDERVYFDKIFYLPSITFDPSGYAVPTQKTFRKFIKVNRIIDCFSTSDSDITSDWDTKKGNMLIRCWSDSTVTPHPSISGNYTVFYKYMM